MFSSIRYLDMATIESWNFNIQVGLCHLKQQIYFYIYPMGAAERF